MARMLGAAGFAGSGCSPRCRRSHNPRPKHRVGAMRRIERAAWRREWGEDENARYGPVRLNVRTTRGPDPR
jgi:hypothetical protein